MSTGVGVGVESDAGRVEVRSGVAGKVKTGKVGWAVGGDRVSSASVGSGGWVGSGDTVMGSAQASPASKSRLKPKRMIDNSLVDVDFSIRLDYREFDVEMPVPMRISLTALPRHWRHLCR
jgi:hypothetical protein